MLCKGGEMKVAERVFWSLRKLWLRQRSRGKKLLSPVCQAKLHQMSPEEASLRYSTREGLLGSYYIESGYIIVVDFDGSVFYGRASEEMMQSLADSIFTPENQPIVIPNLPSRLGGETGSSSPAENPALAAAGQAGEEIKG